MLAHREAGARLGVARDVGHDLPGAQAREQAQARGGGLRAVEVEQQLAQVVVDRERRVGGRVDAARDPGVDLPERDLVGDEHDGLEARAAGLLDVVGGGLGRQARAEHGLARQVAVARVLEHGAGGDLAEPLALEVEALDQPVERDGQHVVVGGVRVGGVRARERDAVAAEDGDATNPGVMPALRGWRLVLVLVFVGAPPLGPPPRTRTPAPACAADLAAAALRSASTRACRPGSTVVINSSAAARAVRDSVRSHQRTSASAAPSSAVDSASTFDAVGGRELREQRLRDEVGDARAVLADATRDRRPRRGASRRTGPARRCGRGRRTRRTRGCPSAVS